MGDLPTLHVNLHSQEQSKKEFVFLVKSTTGISPDLTCQKPNDIDYAVFRGVASV